MIYIILVLVRPFSEPLCPVYVGGTILEETMPVTIKVTLLAFSVEDAHIEF